MDDMDDLRRQLATQRAARSETVSRLKEAADRAAAGRSTPITDSYKILPKESPKAGNETPTERIRRCQLEVEEAHLERQTSLSALKRTSMKAVEFVRQTVPDLLRELEDSDPDDNGSGSGTLAPTTGTPQPEMP
jgi:hypothetical protein